MSFWMVVGALAARGHARLLPRALNDQLRSLIVWFSLQVGTLQWAAPERFTQKNLNEKVDVYAFGVVMWELATKELPFKGMDQMQARNTTQLPSFFVGEVLYLRASHA